MLPLVIIGKKNYTVPNRYPEEAFVGLFPTATTILNILPLQPPVGRIKILFITFIPKQLQKFWL